MPDMKQKLIMGLAYIDYAVERLNHEVKVNIPHFLDGLEREDYTTSEHFEYLNALRRQQEQAEKAKSAVEMRKNEWKPLPQKRNQTADFEAYEQTTNASIGNLGVDSAMARMGKKGMRVHLKQQQRKKLLSHY